MDGLAQAARYRFPPSYTGPNGHPAFTPVGATPVTYQPPASYRPPIGGASSSNAYSMPRPAPPMPLVQPQAQAPSGPSALAPSAAALMT